MPGMLMMYTLFCLLEIVPFYIAVAVLELTMKTDRRVFNSQRSVLRVPLSAGRKACTTTGQQENRFPEAWSRFGFALFCFSPLMWGCSEVRKRQGHHQEAKADISSLPLKQGLMQPNRSQFDVWLRLTSNSWCSCLCLLSAGLLRATWIYVVLGITPRALGILSKHSANRAISQPKLPSKYSIKPRNLQKQPLTPGYKVLLWTLDYHCLHI